MADSDGDYVADGGESDEYGDHHLTRTHGDNYDTGGAQGGGVGAGGGSVPRGSRPAVRDRERDRRRRRDGGTAGGRGGAGARGGPRRRVQEQAAWETVKRSWDTVAEAEDGRVEGVELLEAAEKRRRLLRDTTPLQRGIIRHLVLVLDMSFAMTARDFLPNYYRVAMACAAEFVREFFEQNPISQLAIVGMRDGVAVRVSDMAGNPAEHLERLREWEAVEPQGNPSLQNALEMCRGALFHTPSHGTREVLVVFGALLSSDPGDIHDTIAALIADRIRVSVIGLAAQVAICSEICSKTNGGDDGAYVVALHDVHFRELLLAATTPPATTKAPEAVTAAAANGDDGSLLMMGFPSRAVDAHGVSACACHNRPSREGYACTRCGAKVCRLPVECPACGLTLILSTHLARSYHHLFPLRNWVEVSWAEAARAMSKSKSTSTSGGGAAACCYACLMPFPEVPPEYTIAAKKARTSKEGESTSQPAGPAEAKTLKTAKGVSESGRYACQVCGNHFCIDCDVFAHEVVHNCPGCQSDTRHLIAPAADAAAAAGGEMEVDGQSQVANGHGHSNGNGHDNANSSADGAMIID